MREGGRQGRREREREKRDHVEKNISKHKDNIWDNEDKGWSYKWQTKKYRSTQIIEVSKGQKQMVRVGNNLKIIEKSWKTITM